MYILTKGKDSIESGAYATVDKEGETIIQFFVNEDDAVTYKTHLEAIGQSLHITETDQDHVDKLCAVLGYAYNIVEPGEIVIPKYETFVDYRDSIQETDV